VAWWAFFTWWVLPIECVVVLLAFPVAAGIGAVAFKTAPRMRMRRRDDLRRAHAVRPGMAVAAGLHADGACGPG
jgi:hypothetical protein